jgi:hypothetical protein
MLMNELYLAYFIMYTLYFYFVLTENVIFKIELNSKVLLLFFYFFFLN